MKGWRLLQEIGNLLIFKGRLRRILMQPTFPTPIYRDYRLFKLCPELESITVLFMLIPWSKKAGIDEIKTERLTGSDRGRAA
jgi:hypothetical protein